MKNILLYFWQRTAGVLSYFSRSEAFQEERNFINRSKKERLIQNEAFCFLKVRDLDFTSDEYKRVFVLQKQLAVELHTIEQRREADGVCVSHEISKEKPIGFQLKNVKTNESFN